MLPETINAVVARRTSPNFDVTGMRSTSGSLGELRDKSNRSAMDRGTSACSATRPTVVSVILKRRAVLPSVEQPTNPS
jgi:hypothetical protein